MLIELLNDDAAAVALQACFSLKRQHASMDEVVPALAQALSRKAIAEHIIEALSDLGTEARSAIPSLLALSGENTSEYNSLDEPIESALKHIGPPSPSHIDGICRFLDHKDLDRTALAANSLSLMGRAGKPAADRLLIVIDELLDYAAETDEKLNLPQDEDSEVAVDIEDIIFAAEYCVAAYWSVTRNADRFVELVERLELESDYPITFSDPSPWTGFSDSDIDSVKRLFSSNYVNDWLTACNGVNAMGFKGTRHHHKVFEFMEEYPELTWDRWGYLCSTMSPEVATKIASAVVVSYENGRMDLENFALKISSLGSGTPGSETILEKGLEGSDSWAVTACAQALCRTSTDLEKTSSLIVQAAAQNHITMRTAIETLRQMPRMPLSVRDFLITGAAGENVWTRHEAVAALGEMGPDAKFAIEKIEPLIDANFLDERLQAAKALYLITGEANSFDHFLEIEFENRNNRVWELAKCMEAIADLGPRGTKFQHHILANRKPFEQQAVVKLCKALQKIASKESIELLAEIAKSTDWEAKSAADSAIAAMRPQKTGKARQTNENEKQPKVEK